MASFEQNNINSFPYNIPPFSTEFPNFYENRHQIPKNIEPIENDGQKQLFDDSRDSGAGKLTDEEENNNNKAAGNINIDEGKNTNQKATTKGDESIEQCRNERPSECVVCGKAAKCCHFDVPSCLGCRSFFRRSILNQRQYQCQKLGKCQIEIDQNCRACRFDRCILGGMNLRAIKTFSDNMELQKLAEHLERRRKLLLKMNNGISNEMGTIEWNNNNNNGSKFKLLSNENSTAIGILNLLKCLDQKLMRIRYSEGILHNPEFYGMLTLSEILLKPENILAKAEHFSERNMAKFTLQTHKALIGTPLGHGPGAKVKPKWLFVDSFLCLEMIKTFPVIQQLSLKAKISLLSSNAFGFIVFSQSFYTIFDNNDIFTFPDGFSPLCFHQTFNKDIYHKLFFHNLEPYKRISLNVEEFLLLRVILLLQNASIELPKEDEIVVQTGLDIYSKILMQYERQRFGNFDGVKRYAELIFLLGIAINVGNEHRNFILNLMLLHKNSSLLEHPDYMDNVILGVNKP